VYAVSDKLKEKGIVKGELIICHMLNSDHENPCVDMLVNDKLLTVSSHQDFFENWFVYTGDVDGSGFIDDRLKRIAMAML